MILSDRKALPQAPEATHGVGLDMRAEPIAPGVGQVVDQGDVAEMIGATPIGPVGLKGVETVRSKDHQPATRS